EPPTPTAIANASAFAFIALPDSMTPPIWEGLARPNACGQSSGCCLLRRLYSDGGEVIPAGITEMRAWYECRASARTAASAAETKRAKAGRRSSDSDARLECCQRMTATRLGRLI